MNSFSSVTLVGRLTRDAEMKTLPNDNTIVRFAVAIDRRRRDGENFVTDTTFVEVTYFGQSARNICQFLVKGLLVGVTGELNQRKWESQDGAKNSRIEVLASNVHLIESKSMREARSGSVPMPAEDTQPTQPAHNVPKAYSPDDFDDSNAPF